ncbi:hypothetical protein B0H65DRAFT_464169 [Neurospora tetraspora]|uniref:Uncharacterized protein n=1 Tax=Neurospora tetraspora TaxID=94610 RepID=A0AAE0JEB8_9PEZI|nr:hypothetical protein B0H65DRAFT_464169 [Neurospora tetraspora]
MPRIHHRRQVIRPHLVLVAGLAVGEFDNHEAEVASFSFSYFFAAFIMFSAIFPTTSSSTSTSTSFLLCCYCCCCFRR